MGLSQRCAVKTRVQEREAEWLLSLAGFPELQAMEPLQGGWDNTNLLLTLADGSKVVLKVCINTDDDVAGAGHQTSFQGDLMPAIARQFQASNIG